MNRQPTIEEASEAEHILEQAILKFSDEARAPRERGTPNPDPVWRPRNSTLRYSPLRGGKGWIWTMDADDQQITAFYVIPTSKGDAFTVVTMHGQARHNFYERLRQQHLYPTQSPYTEWYDFRKRYYLDNEMYNKIKAARS